MIPQARRAGGRALVAGLLVVLVACGRGTAAGGPTAELAGAPSASQEPSTSPEPDGPREPSGDPAGPPGPADTPEADGAGEDVERPPVEEAPDELLDAAPDAAPPPPDTGSYPVPEEIDVVYAQQVVDALDRLLGDAARIAAREQTLDQGFFDRMTAAYQTDELRTAVVPGWLDQADRGFPDLVPEPGDPRSTVLSLDRTDPGCVVLEVERDYNALYPEPQEPRRVHIALVAAPEGTDRGLNPTPWVIADEDVPPEEDPCA